MALIKKGIFGNVSGKISTIQGSHWKGRDILSAWNSRQDAVSTLPQLNQQSKMGYCRHYGKGVKNLIETIYADRQYSKIGSWASFIRQNISLVSSLGVPNSNFFKMGIQRFSSPVFTVNSILGLPVAWIVNMPSYSSGNNHTNPLKATILWINQTRKYSKWIEEFAPTGFASIGGLDYDAEIGDELLFWVLIVEEGTNMTSNGDFFSVIAGSG